MKLFYPFLLVLSGLILVSCSVDIPPEKNPNIEPYTITNFNAELQATIFNDDNGIYLTWKPADNISTYTIYRYQSREDDYREARIITVKNAVSYYDMFSADNPLIKNTPYYYQLKYSTNDGGHYESDLIMGIYGDMKDPYEPNNQLNYIIDEDATTDTFNPANPPFLYVLSDGEEIIEYDQDWYKYKGVISQFDIIVTFDADSDFDYEDIKVEYHYPDNDFSENKIDSSGLGSTEQKITFNFSTNNESMENIEVYFKIYVDTTELVDKTKNVFQYYNVEIKTGI